MTDRLALARALENGGIGRDAAEHIATEIFDAIHDNVATKADIAEVKVDLRGAEQRLDARIDALRADLALVEHRLMTRLGGMIVAATGILIAIRYFG